MVSNIQMKKIIKYIGTRLQDTNSGKERLMHLLLLLYDWGVNKYTNLALRE